MKNLHKQSPLCWIHYKLPSHHVCKCVKNHQKTDTYFSSFAIVLSSHPLAHVIPQLAQRIDEAFQPCCQSISQLTKSPSFPIFQCDYIETEESYNCWMSLCCRLRLHSPLPCALRVPVCRRFNFKIKIVKQK